MHQGQIQWGSEYRSLKYQKHLNTKLFGVWISNCLVFKCFVLCSRPTIQIPDPYIRKQVGVDWSSIQMVRLSGIQIAIEYWAIWQQTSFQPFKYRSSLLFRSPMPQPFANRHPKCPVFQGWCSDPDCNLSTFTSVSGLGLRVTKDVERGSLVLSIPRKVSIRFKDAHPHPTPTSPKSPKTSKS